MQNMKKKACDSNNSNHGGDPKQKERHIVSWSQEEDDILREQIGIHGTNNWALIASKFENKTTRQCRRRWFTYLNSDFKKGGWSPEEDMLLCEAHKIFGNKWTEIAKVVSGRTDNAVKNRFSTLCKKRAKHEASEKENSASYINTNNKRTMFDNKQNTDGILETSVHPMKLRRKHIAAKTEDCNLIEGLGGDSRATDKQLRPPLAVLVQNCHKNNTSRTQVHANNKKALKDASCCNMIEGTFLRKDDPKIIALVQQAELLSSLAVKVNTEKTDQNFQNAWKVVQDFLKHTKESDVLGFHISNIDFQLENFKDLVEDLYEGSRDSSFCEVKPPPAEAIKPCSLLDDILPSCDKLNDDLECVCPLPNSEFNSPFQVTPLFRSMAEGIPSPQFSESEKHFLLKTLGMKSTPPPCKKALLHCL